MKFVSDYSNNNTKKLISQQNDSQESNEPEYDDKVTELEKKQEEQGIMTTNQIF